MAGKDIVTMSQKELKRLHIINKILDKRLKQIEAVKILGLCDRQIRRIVKRIRIEGDRGIIHKSRGKDSNRAFPEDIKEKVINIYKDKYPDFGPTLANEKLSEIDKIKLGTQTLRSWLIEKGEWQVSHKHRKHRAWRERKHHYGEMEQVDGSHHDWFEGRGPKCVLMAYIDDAESRVYARFYEYEGTFPFMDSFKRYAYKYGLPHSIYIDRHSTYKSTKKPTIEDELNNKESLSEVGRALNELGVEVIFAQSAQAKGRIERLFRTFQDRVIKEMRLRGIKSIKEANKFLKYYLPIFNKRFSVKAIEQGDLHQPLPKDIELNKILCKKTEHT
ncbi:MAG: ISNCY family transposase, partial [Candidatus Omnitrophota bacterium]